MTDMYISKARERELLEELFETVSFDVESEGIPEDPEGEAYPEDSVASAFDRAMEIVESKGLPDTDPDPSPKPSAARLRKYWTKGEGAAKIRWGTPGDFKRCVKELREHVGTGAEGLCNVYHRSATGAAPGKGHKELGIINNHPIFTRVKEIQKKAFANHFGLSTSYESIGSKELDGSAMELKVRRVRTPAGAKRFGQPIGSIIVRDIRMTNLKINAPKFDGWDSVTGANGKNYDVGKVDGEYHAYGENDWDDLVASAKTEDELYRKLNDASAKKGKGKTPKGDAGEPESREMRGKQISVGDIIKGRSGKWLRVAKISEGMTEGKLRVQYEDGSNENISEEGGYPVQYPSGKKPGKDTTPKRPAGTSRFAFKNKDERDDFVWDNTTYPQWDRYEEMTDAEKTRYAELRKGGKKHTESYKEVMAPSKPKDKPSSTGGGTTVKKPKRAPAGPKYDDVVAEAEKLGTPAQAKQIRKYLKNEQMVQDYLDARKKKRSHAQAIGDALNADIARAKERAKGGRSADPKVMAGQGVLFRNPPK